MKKQLMTFLLCGSLFATAQQPVDYVNPFIGTSNYGTTNPGAVCPQGMMSVVPFNVMGSEKNRFDKDSQWWSTPYGIRPRQLERCGMPGAGRFAIDADDGRVERGL